MHCGPARLLQKGAELCGCRVWMQRCGSGWRTLSQPASDLEEKARRRDRSMRGLGAARCRACHRPVASAPGRALLFETSRERIGRADIKTNSGARAGSN